MKKITFQITQELYTQLGLTDSATDNDVAKAIIENAKKAARVDELQAKYDGAVAAKTKAETDLNTFKESRNKEEVTGMLNAACTGKKISVKVKDQLAKDYADRPTELKALLEGMSAYVSVTSQIQTSTLPAKFEGKTWDQLYEANLLKELKEKHYDLYKQMWEEEHGQAYNG